MGMVVDKVGTSSVIYRIGLFQGDGDEAAAEGRFVHVYVDNTDPAPAGHADAGRDPGRGRAPAARLTPGPVTSPTGGGRDRHVDTSEVCDLRRGIPS